MTMTENNTMTTPAPTRSVFEGLQEVRDAMSVRRVFGDAYETDGVTIIPVARIRGGGGGGGGDSSDDDHDEGGFGTGFGISSRPVGAYEVHGSTVDFRPAIDVSGLIKRAQVLAGIIAVCTAVVLRAKYRAG